ncbi:TPA: hypothetical protein R5Z00_000228 [Campylobacter coli]|nr:hypothetical protein [Campylobacter coli]HED6602465.1 hypothetical protein [Campylobacter coli]
MAANLLSPCFLLTTLKNCKAYKFKKEYDNNIGKIHYAGCEGDFSLLKKHFPLKIYKKDEIFKNGFRTI